MNNKQIYVTQPFLPPLEDLIPYLREIWETRILTNDGPFHYQLEQALCNYLGVDQISLFANGTIALITALKALRITGEVITTPFSFIATSHALLWNNLKPVFVDISSKTLNLDPSKIEAAITPQTSAILPVHCYGNPCDVDIIKAIADKYRLKVIYDAAHAFGVQCHCGSVLNHGDLSVLSFHATKVYNTFEGGAIVCHDAETKEHFDDLKNFGITSETSVVTTGINGKMNEFQAALGLLQLEYVDRAVARRGIIDSRYREAIRDIHGLTCVEDSGQIVNNHSYFPILVQDEYPLCRDRLYESLKENGINARRYFYPLISHFSMYRDLSSASSCNLPVAFDVASRVLCLPIYPDLSDLELESIIKILDA